MDLDLKAWDLWTAYRTAIGKPLKSVSEEAAKLELVAFGVDQMAVVNQSRAKGWDNLYALPSKKTDPSLPKVRTKVQQEADTAHWDYLNRESEKHWNTIVVTPLGKLQLCAALYARYDTYEDQSSLKLSEKRSWLRDTTAQLLRECDPALVLADYHVSQYVLRMFSGAGIRRLELRVKEAA